MNIPKYDRCNKLKNEKGLFCKHISFNHSSQKCKKYNVLLYHLYGTEIAVIKKCSQCCTENGKEKSQLVNLMNLIMIC